MTQVQYGAETMIIMTDPGSWKDRLHQIRRRRQRQGWALVAIFPQHSTHAVQGKTMGEPCAGAITLLFQRRQREDFAPLVTRYRRKTGHPGPDHHLLRSRRSAAR
jgi:hypothetical protein